MKINIQLESTSVVKLNDLVPGKRVAVRVAKNAWYCGQITRITQKGNYEIVFNDGDTTKCGPQFIRPINSIGKQTAYTDAEIQSLIHATPQINLNDVWCTSDIHGCFKTFKKLYSDIKPKRLYVLGDCIDRGPYSKEVLDFCMANKSKIRVLMGNHEDMMLQVLAQPKLQTWWMGSGGRATMNSFGVKNIGEVPEQYIDFIRQMRLHVKIGNYRLSHAGIDYNKRKHPLKPTEVNRQFILWNRSVKAPPADKHITLVVGHTPKTLTTIKKSAQTRLVRIDGGCSRHGVLIAFNLGTREIRAYKLADSVK